MARWESLKEAYTRYRRGLKPRQRRIQALGYLSFVLPKHTLTLIEVDGTYVAPTVVSHLEVAPGMRFSVLVKTDQPVGDYWMTASVRWRASGPSNGLSILRYSGAATPATVPAPAPATLVRGPPEALEWGQNLTAHPTLRKRVMARGPANLTPVLEARQLRTADGFLRWAMNNVSYALPRDVSLLESAYSKTLAALPRETAVITLPSNGVVDVIVQNLAGPSGVCEIHPWHLHGHSFWDLGGGPGYYDANSTSATLPENPVYRDVVAVYPYGGAYFQTALAAAAPCGWKRIRFVADNPGVWPFHCHIPSHMVMGMMVVFAEGLDDLPHWPREARY
ncbi:Cupredoxin [Zopfochytrium polystomum]|nr:Cupredoxin [Zopfochytrium polystomum]